MKIIKNLIIVDTNNAKLLVNSLDGIIDKVGNPIFDIISKWQKYENIVPENDLENMLYDNLKSRGYLVESHEEEITKKDKIIETLRNNHLKQKAKCRKLTFIMTYNCNFRCPYCFEKGLTSRDKIMSIELIDAALKLVKNDFESVGLFGGEPLLIENMESIKHLISKTSDKTFEIITNGYHLLEYFDILSPLKLYPITVTIDGNEEDHNGRRFLDNKQPTYQKIMQGIQKYLQSGIPINIRMNLENEKVEEGNLLKLKLLDNFSEFKSLVSFEISLMNGIPLSEKVEPILELYNTDIKYTDEEKLSMNRQLNSFSPIINSLTVGRRPKPLYTFCYAHDNNLVVDPYGDIYTCFSSVGKEELSIGTYYPEVKFKTHSLYTRNIETIPECRECEYSLLCGGGCPLSLDSYDDFNRPMCSSIRTQIHDILPLFYQANEGAKNK